MTSWKFVMVLMSLPAFYACSQDMNTTNGMPMQMPPMPLADVAQTLSAGLMVGEPTGPTVKYFLNDTIAVDGAAGWSAYRHADAEIHGDILLHDFNLLPVSQGKLPVYVGAGLMVRFRHDRDNQAGVRIPFGISYMFENIPVDVFAEIGPAIIFAPSFQGEVVGGFGARYRF
jgi:hypothetical protein